MPGGEEPRASAWWSGSVSTLARAEDAAVIGQLAAVAAVRSLPLRREQVEAWATTVEMLKRLCIDAISEPCSRDWELVIEFELPRRAVRPDVVFLAGDVIIPLELKVGAARYDRAARLQVAEYAWDLRDFHESSHDHPVVPVLVATEAVHDDIDLAAEPAADRPQCCRPSSLLTVLRQISAFHKRTDAQLDVGDWSRAPYRPTPGILEAARDVYAGHDVREISASYADNLHTTVDAVRERIARAKGLSQRWLCFVTGVPGSGKTLVGLSAVHQHGTGLAGAPLGVYLSGNGPLVDVLRYAIATDLRRRDGTLPEEARRLAKTFIQPVHRFVQELALSDEPPSESVMVFDEAQRAWDAHQMGKKQGVHRSEAATTLAIMERAPGCAVVIALIGEGQEINSGEAGIEEWFSALLAHPSWRVCGSSALSARAQRLADRFEIDDGLNLEVSVRSPRARAIAEWAEAVTIGQLAVAGDLAAGFHGFPLHVTRDLEALRHYLDDRAQPDRRTGLIASSQARRLRPFGIEMDSAFQGAINWPRWFVDGRGDIRSSYALEVAASEFKCQGLEIDYAGLCWGSDFTWDRALRDWRALRMHGGHWQRDGRMQHARNRYRVLLTRARYGMVIWVPRPTREIPLVDAQALDTTADALLAAGCTPLP